MALVNCPECKKEVSTDAKSCPHCGKNFIVQQSILVPLIQLLIGLGGLLIAGYFIYYTFLR